jgi:virulence factor Mce-like protein
MLIAIVAVVGASFDLSLNAGKANIYQVKAHFPTVNGVIEGSDVFFGGVRVGNVSDLKVDPDAHGATVTLNIEKKYAPVHEGAKVAVRPKSLLGEKYIAATVGDPSKPAICDGCQLPDSATAVNVELDELINILDEPTRKELQQLISNLGTGLAGQGPNTNQLLQTGQTNLNDLSSVTNVLHQRDAELKRIIEALTKLTATLSTDPNRATYVNLLKHSDQVLQTLIAEDAQVQQSIDRADQFFNEIDQGLNGQGGNLQGIFQDLPNTITQLDALSVALGRQGNIGYAPIKLAGPGTIEGDLIFGSIPSNGVGAFTNDVFTRVEPSQGCFSVNGRSTDGNGLQQNNGTVLKDGSGNGANGVCTLPGGGIATCAGNITSAPAGCIFAVLQALCALHIAPDTVCTGPLKVGAAAQASRGAATTPGVVPQVPGAPAVPTPTTPQLPVRDPNLINPLLGFLLH